MPLVFCFIIENFAQNLVGKIERLHFLINFLLVYMGFVTMVAGAWFVYDWWKSH